MESVGYESALAVIGAAGFGAASWDEALGRIADLTGAACGELSVVRDGAIVEATASGVGADVWSRFEALGGGSTLHNPRVAFALRPGLRGSLIDEQMAPRDTLERLPIYAEFFVPHDFQYWALAPIRTVPGETAALAVHRGRGGGVFSDEARSLLERLAVPVEAAYRFRRAARDEGVRIAAGDFDMVSVAAIICDAGGRVLDCSHAGADQLRRGAPIGVRAGRLYAPQPHWNRLLYGAVARAMTPDVGAAGAPSLVIDDGASWPVQVQARALRNAGSSFSLMFACAVLLTPVAAGSPEGRRALARRYRLTEAEVEVCLQTAEGARPSEVALRRGVAIATVRSQLKRVYAALGADGHASVRRALQAGIATRGEPGAR